MDISYLQKMIKIRIFSKTEQTSFIGWFFVWLKIISYFLKGLKGSILGCHLVFYANTYCVNSICNIYNMTHVLDSVIMRY